MKIYHTETQADYDALLIRLKELGYKYINGSEFSEERPYVIVWWTDMVMRSYQELMKDEEFKSLPIIKYKAKADDKMRFTKENVGKILDEWFTENAHLSAEGIIANIEELDDTPKKAVVPKYFDDWYQEIKSYWISGSSAKQFALWKLCQQGFGHDFEDVRDRKISYSSDLAKWLRKNRMLAIDAVLNGYTIKPEQLYHIPLPDLETSDGLQQMLSKRKGDKHYFASRPNDKLQQRYTKEEIAQVPEVYKPFAKPIDEVIQNEL